MFSFAFVGVFECEWVFALFACAMQVEFSFFLAEFVYGHSVWDYTCCVVCLCMGWWGLTFVSWMWYNVGVCVCLLCVVGMAGVVRLWRVGFYGDGYMG